MMLKNEDGSYHWTNMGLSVFYVHIVFLIWPGICTSVPCMWVHKGSMIHVISFVVKINTFFSVQY